MICIYNICIYIDKLNFREIVQKYSTSYEQGPSFNLWHPKNLNKTKKKKKRIWPANWDSPGYNPSD